MEQLTPPKDEASARNYIDQLRKNSFDQIERDMEPSLKDESLRDKLTEMAALFPDRRPVSSKVVGIHAFSDANSNSVSVTLEYEFPERWLLADITTKVSNGTVTITGFHVGQIPDSLEHTNRLTLAGKGDDHYMILVMAALSLGLSFYAFVACLRTRMGKKKWLWAILCLGGVGQIGLDWTTGQCSFTPLSVHLGTTAGATAPPYGAWVVWVSVPLGAVLFLIRRERLSGVAIASSQPAPEPPADSQPHDLESGVDEENVAGDAAAQITREE